jgi:hypothetical protein
MCLPLASGTLLGAPNHRAAEPYLIVGAMAGG